MPKKSNNNKKVVEDTQQKKTSAIEVEGKVLDVLPRGHFRV